MSEEKRTASQRIEDLERAVSSIFQNLDGVIKDINRFKDILKLLDNKVTSIVQAASSGDGITDETVKNMMMNNTVEELKEKVNGMKAQGILVEQTEVSETSFIVCQETDANGAITNPRIQFVVAALIPDLRTKIIGSKVGDTVVLQEGLAGLNILEIYGVTMPKPPESAAPEASADASTSGAVLDSAPVAASS